MKKSFATRTLKGLSAALLCCCSAPAFGGVMLVDFEMPEGVEAGSSLSGGPDGASVANSSSSKDGAAGGASSGGAGGSAGGSAQGGSSSAGSSGGGGGGSSSGGGSGPAGAPTQPTGGTAQNGGTTPTAAGPGTETGNGGVGPGDDMIVTDPIVLVSQPNNGGDHGPSVSTDPTFSYMPPLSVVADEGGSTLPAFAADLDEPSAAVDPGASAPEASAVIVWAVLGTTAAFGCKLRRRSGR